MMDALLVVMMMMPVEQLQQKQHACTTLAHGQTFAKRDAPKHCCRCVWEGVRNTHNTKHTVCEGTHRTALPFRLTLPPELICTTTAAAFQHPPTR
jgi:hypothetical protein